MNMAPRVRLGRSVGRRFLFEWIGVGCAGVAIVLLTIGLHWTARADDIVYDLLLTARTHAVSSDIVVVEIDNASIAKLGRWPWPRADHGELVKRLTEAGAAAIVYDVLFTEPSSDDAAFAQALAATPTYLPILLSPLHESGLRELVPPVAPLANAAAGLGHINFEVDRDGIVRSVALFEGDAHQRWPQLMVPVWRAVRAGKIALASGAPPARPGADPTLAGGPSSEARFLIPFSAGAQDYRRVSFVDVLEGRVPPEVLRGRIALVGVTASGLYDRFATPLSGKLGTLPGVYIHANVLDALLAGTAIEPAPAYSVALVSLTVLALMLAGFLVLTPWRALLVCVGLGAAAFAVSVALLYGLRIWLSPVPAAVALVLVYPMWSWRRLEMTMAYLRRALLQLADEPYLLPDARKSKPGREYEGDALAQQMALMEQAAQRLQDMRRFVWDSLDSVPEPILVTDLRGVVLIANHAARQSFGRLGIGTAEGRLIAAVLGGFALVNPVDQDAEAIASAHAHWPAPLDPARGEFAGLMARGVELRARDGSEYLLRYAPCTNAQGQAVGWIAGLADVTALHDAERQREDALRLLSHDMRSPQASIVALVETERERGALDSVTVREVMERIERYARRSLKLADDFVQLARAESQAYALQPASLAELLINACDEVWPQAHAKQIRIDTEFEANKADEADKADEAHWILADASLMTRALVNVLNNAVKYSPPETRILCTIRGEGQPAARVICSIRDEGYGIALEDQADLFAPFRRFHTVQQPEVSGAGLGMAFVKTVVERHGGDIHVESAPGRGTTLTMDVPALAAPS